MFTPSARSEGGPGAGKGSFQAPRPAVANGVVYISFVNTLYGVGTILLDAATGVSLWHYPTGGVNSSPIVVNGRIYVAGPGEIDVFGLL
jgi:outer membrane protein assembly factor BamB